MTAVYLIPLTDNALENFSKTITDTKEFLMKGWNETEAKVVQDLFDKSEELEEPIQNMGLWAYINNKGSNNLSYWRQMKENDLVLFFDMQEKLSAVGRIYRKPEGKVDFTLAEKIFGQAEFNLFFSMKELVHFGKCNVKFSDVGATAGYDFNFPRGNLRIKDWRVDEYDVVNKIYELLLLETENEKALGVTL